MSTLSAAQFSKSISTFIVFKRSLGYSYRRSEATLRGFERFVLQMRSAQSRINLEAVIRTWLFRSPRRKPPTLFADLAVVRQLCLYLRRTDATTFIPPTTWAPWSGSRYTPHVFSLEEIRRLILGVDLYQRRRFWPEMFRMLLIVTYCTGIRLGEAARLQYPDLDRERHVLHIRDSKGRSRDVPFQADIAREFTHYLRERTRLLRTCGREGEPAVFVGCDGRSITVGAISDAIRGLLRRLGMKSQKGRCGPRPYDLRSTFAVHRLTAWYKEGADLQARLPWLSAYMGHVDLLGTEVYLHATPELLGFASERFAARFAQTEETL